ncbi:MAG: hypothetical protein JW750_00140 [Anaerolineaceae bacterium]|nr:hypothetical protein [Anaerolineaceae bacterium]
MNEKKSTILFLVFQAIIILAAFAIGLFYAKWFALWDQDYPILNEAKTILEDQGLYDIPQEPKMEYGMIRGMVEAYGDPYTAFIEPFQHELQTQQLEGKYGGIGARIERDTENRVFLYPFPDSPAKDAGILDGDQLLMIEDLEITPETTTEEIIAGIRGPIDSKLTMSVASGPAYDTPRVVKVKRGEVPLPSITYNLAINYPSVGIVKINLIADTTPDEVTNAIYTLTEMGASKFILDLRNNGGGMVEAGIKTASLFLDKGLTVIKQQYKGESVETFDVKSQGEFSDLPMIILVNEQTASAAEIIAGSLQGHDRALLVGHQTYGKNVIQLVFNLRDDSSLHVTAAEWWIPGLPDFSLNNGLIPDLQLNDLDSNDPQVLEFAIAELLK